MLETKQVKVEKKTRHFHVVQLKVCPLARPFAVRAAAGSTQGRTVDALALASDEGRDKLR